MDREGQNLFRNNSFIDADEPGRVVAAEVLRLRAVKAA